MAQLYLILTASSAAALGDLVTGSLGGGYTLMGGAFVSGNQFAQTMMLQSVSKDNYNINPQRLSRAFRMTHTESAYYNATASYQ